MLMNQSSKPRFTSFNLPALCRISAITIFSGACTFGAAAQQSIPPSAPQLVASATDKPLDLATVAGVNYSSSSGDATSPVSSVEAERLNLSAGAGLQPPPRRRYGRPRYNDNQHNADGSNKYTFVLGAGMTAPMGNTFHYLNTNYAVQAGGGRNFNKNFGVLLQFDYDAFGFNARTLTNQSALYNSSYVYGAGAVSGLDGNSHVWSFTLNPIYNVFNGDKVGGYVVGGVGFFHKTANFTVPGTGTYCDYYGYCYSYAANQTIDKYTSNAPGFDGGIGLTYKPGRFSGERVFVEARYVFVDNQHKAGFTVANYTQITATSTNLYPANSNRTTYMSYKAGIRF
jgi:hypothetical protein